MRKLATLVLLVIAGCTGQSASPPNKSEPSAAGEPAASAPGSAAKKPTPRPLTHRIPVDTEYFKNSPQSGDAADGTFKAGTKVRLERETGNYSKVETEDGVSGYVNVDNLEVISN